MVNVNEGVNLIWCGLESVDFLPLFMEDGLYRDILPEWLLVVRGVPCRTWSWCRILHCIDGVALQLYKYKATVAIFDSRVIILV